MDLYLVIAFGIAVLAYAMVWRSGDATGWFIGIGHAVLALLALSAWQAARDRGFATAMALLAIYGGAMAAAEIVARLRRPREGA